MADTLLYDSGNQTFPELTPGFFAVGLDFGSSVSLSDYAANSNAARMVLSAEKVVASFKVRTIEGNVFHGPFDPDAGDLGANFSPVTTMECRLFATHTATDTFPEPHTKLSSELVTINSRTVLSGPHDPNSIGGYYLYVVEYDVSITPQDLAAGTYWVQFGDRTTHPDGGDGFAVVLALSAQNATYEIRLWNGSAWVFNDGGIYDYQLSYQAYGHDPETDTHQPGYNALFDDCGDFLGLREFDARLFDNKEPTTGVRRTWGSDGDVLEDVISGASFELQERGGFGGGSLDLLGAWDKSTLDGTERVDIWVYDSPTYRAYLRIPEKDLSNPESHRPQLYGMVALLDKWLVKRKYAYGCDTDIAQIFADIAVDYVVVTGRFPNCSLDYSSPVGATLKEFDPRGQSVAQAFNALADFAPNAADWGARMDDQRPVPGDVLYFHPRPEDTSYVLAVGDNVNTLTYPVDTHQVVNSLKITGGQVKQPNLAPNGGFEELKPASEDAGNYLLDPGFEGAAANWTGSGGATVQFQGNGGAHGSARSGSNWLELDQNGEQAVQTVFIVPGLEYTFSTWARLETQAAGNSFVMQMDAMNSVNTIVATTSQGFTTGNGDITSEVYDRFSISLDLAAYPAAVKIKVTLRAQGGSASNDGVLFDDCGLYAECAAAQESWRLTYGGVATVSAIDWASQGTAIGPRSGGLCVHLKCANISGGSDYADIYTPISLSPSVNGAERYTLTCFYHVNGQGAAGDNVLAIGAVSIDSAGVQGTVWQSSIYIGNPSTWQMARIEIPTESDTAKLQLFIRSRTNRDLYLDDVMLVQGEVPDEVENSGGYWEADTYQRSIDVTSSLLAGMLDAGIDDSIDAYGEHEEEASSDLVTDLDTALAFAAGQFNAKATPKIEAQLQVYQPREIVKQDGKLRLVNLPQPPPALWPARTTVTVKGEAIEMNVELGNMRPDLAELLKAVKKSK